MHELLVAAALLHGPGLPAPPPELRGDDSLARLAALLDATNKSPADRPDALFFAVRGRFATGPEHLRARHLYGEKPTGAQLLAFASGPNPLPFAWPVAPYSAFWPPRSPCWPDSFLASPGRPFVFPTLLEGGPSIAALPSFRPTESFVPNPLALPFLPWIPPGSLTPLPRVGAERDRPKKP